MSGSNRSSGGIIPQVTPANPSASTQKPMVFVVIGVVVLVLLAGLGYQQMKVAEMQASVQRQEEMARLEIERKRNEEQEAERKRFEIERQAQLAAEAKKQRELELGREVERRSLSIVERKGSQILNSAYPLAFNALSYQSAEPRGVKKADGAYIATIRLNYLNLLDKPHHLDIAFNFGDNGESQEWRIVDFSDFIAPNKLTVETLLQIVR